MAGVGKTLSASRVQMARASALHTALDGGTSFVTGNMFAQVLCVTGALLLGEACYEALRKAFAALGYEDEDFCTISLAAVQSVAAEDLLLAIEMIDPLVVVSLDKAAASATASALRIPVPRYGMAVAGGPGGSRRFVAVEDFEASLATLQLKKISWSQLKAARRQTRFM